MKVTLVGGARPNWPKIAPIVRELGRRQIDYRIIHTGQHFQNKLDIYEELELPPPDVSFACTGSHAYMTAMVMMAVEDDLKKHRPDWLVVVGDVNSTLGAALAAAKLGVKVAHVEAGLRSGDWSMPEEINRVLVDQLADLWLMPDMTTDANLMGLRKNVNIEPVGNVMIDSLVWALNTSRAEQVIPPGCIIATVHRPSNCDDLSAWAKIVQCLYVATDTLKVPLYLLKHPRQPKVKGFTPALHPDVSWIEPLGYIDMVRALKEAKLVLTDSGGVQEETTALGVPCLTLRENTERPITVSEGTNTVVGTNAAEVLRHVKQIAAGPHTSKGRRRPALWDGRAAARIVDALHQHCKK